jgi:hypothetical protein
VTEKAVKDKAKTMSAVAHAPQLCDAKKNLHAAICFNAGKCSKVSDQTQY